MLSVIEVKALWGSLTKKQPLRGLNNKMNIYLQYITDYFLSELFLLSGFSFAVKTSQTALFLWNCIATDNLVSLSHFNVSFISIFHLGCMCGWVLQTNTHSPRSLDAQNNNNREVLCAHYWQNSISKRSSPGSKSQFKNKFVSLSKYNKPVVI